MLSRSSSGRSGSLLWRFLVVVPRARAAEKNHVSVGLVLLLRRGNSRRVVHIFWSLVIYEVRSWCSYIEWGLNFSKTLVVDKSPRERTPWQHYC